MTRRLLIEKGVFAARAALLQDDILEQYILENSFLPSLVGEIRLARVTSHLNGIDAAIVSLGNGLNGFLRAQDWPGENSDQPFSKRLTEGSLLPVTITKDPLDDKPYQVSGYVTLECDIAVLKPHTQKLQISKSIQDQQLERDIETSLSKLECGVLIRTKATQYSATEIRDQILALLDDWHSLQKKIEELNAPGVVLAAPTFSARVIDLWGQKATEIVTSPPAPAQLFDREGIHQECRSATEKHVDLTGGGFLTIEPTEALVAIDVNSAGNEAWASKGTPQQKTNETAAIEIARQLRIRNLSGMILIDFAGQQSRQETEALIRILKAECREDNARVEVLGGTALGLMQLTRQRTAAPLHKTLQSFVSLKEETPPLSTLFQLEQEILSQVGQAKSRLCSVHAGSKLASFLRRENIPSLIYSHYQVQLTVEQHPQMTDDDFKVTMT